MGKRQKFIDALNTLGDGRYTYDGVGGCSRYVRLALGMAGVITQEEADNKYGLWAAQHYRSTLRDKTRFEELPPTTPKIPSDILWWHGEHVGVHGDNLGGGTTHSDRWEAAPESSHGVCKNGRTGVGLWVNHNYDCTRTPLTCIYRIIEDDVPQPETDKIKAPDLRKLAIDVCTGVYGPTAYNNTYPHNVGRWDGSRWTWDCLGFVHTLTASPRFKGDRTVLGGGAKMDSWVLATDEAATLKSCTTYGPFKGAVKVGELLQSSGHVGLFIGDYSIKRADGTIDWYNTAESTVAWGGGALLSWTDVNTGYRYNKKGGQFRSVWNYHGELSRVDYSADTTVPAPEIVEKPTLAVLKPKEKLALAIDIIDRVGGWGDNPTRREKLTAKYGRNVAIQIQDLINLAYKEV